MVYIRPTGSTIELKDTPEMKEFAKSMGWIEEDLTEKKNSKGKKNSSQKVE